MRTGAEFIASLNDGRRVWVGDELIEDLATHPKTKGYVEAIAKFYDLHHDPEFQDRTTFVDEAGVRRSRVWFIPRTKEELRQRRAFYETMMREVGGTAFSRMPDSSNAVLLTYIDDPEPWETQSIGTEGRPLAQNIRDKWAFFADEDIYTSAMFIDPQTDRGGDGSGPSPALTIVGETDEGIIVNGVKPVGTSAAFAQWLHLGVFFRPGLPPDQVIFGVIPTNTPGVTIVSRESYVNDDAANHPMAAMGDELDSAAIIENVLIPWDCVFHVRNVEHAMLYPKRVFDWHQYYVLVRAAVRAELMVGLAMAMANSLGTYEIPEVKVRLAKFVEFQHILQAAVLAAEEHGFITPGGQFKPAPLRVDTGRAYFLEHYPAMIQELLDLCGRVALMYPSEGQWNDEKLRKWMEPTVTGAHGDGYDRIKMARVIHDLFLTEWGTRQQMFDNFQSTPLRMIRFLNMMRFYQTPTGDHIDFARQVCGIEKAETAIDAQPAYIRRIDRAAAPAGAAT
ncbi:4-hydroxyphenylacetate 3-hydroxylase N-terminal domain-containing protein [Mycolicibacterium chlorophenolicum]|nr:4-hydroxyphenylacetate 3-hydroxylase N-terminal domain-containing protein [Mycolicibacterium chlorophenolicum]